MIFSKPRFLWGEPLFFFELKVDPKEKMYNLQLIFAHFSIFCFYRIGDIGRGFDILGFGVHSK